MAWTILVEDHQRNISAKLYWNRSSGFSQEDFKLFFFWLQWQPESCLDSKSLNKFQSVPPNDQSCEIWLKLVQWFTSRLWTTDRRLSRQTVSDHNSSPWAFGSGELKRGKWKFIFDPAHNKTYNKTCVTSKDQPVHPPSMARALVFR